MRDRPDAVGRSRAPAVFIFVLQSALSAGASVAATAVVFR